MATSGCIFCLFLCLSCHVLCSSKKSKPEVQSSVIYNATERNGNIYEYAEPENASVNCNQEIFIETEFVVLENGSLLLPQSDHLYSQDSYVVQNDTAYICAPGETRGDTEESDSSKEYNFSKEFLSCAHMLIDLNEFLLFKNGTIYVEIYRKKYGPSDYYLQEKGVYVCMPNFKEMLANMTNQTDTELIKFSKAFIYVSHIGIIISAVSLFLHLLVFCSFDSVRNLPGCCLASLSLSLLAAYICFMCSAFVATNTQCAVLGMFVYYFFLTSFFWMNAIAFDVWRSFRVVMRELRISSHRIPWRRFLAYSLYSWLTPAVLVVLAALADSSDVLPEQYRPFFGVTHCWFGKRKALLVFFATPLFCVMALNAIFFLDSAYVINRATLKRTQATDEMMRKRFFMFMRLALIMGLTWIVGIICGYADQTFLWYIFVILNTLQGLFIFIVFSCSSKVRLFFLKRMGADATSSQGTSVRTISHTSHAL